MLTVKALAHRVGLVAGLCALAAVPAYADDDNGYGYLRAVEGSATLMQAGSGTRTPAELNQPVLAGDRLWVPERSRVEIVLADRNLLRIDGGSELILERLAASPDSHDRGTMVRLLEGNVQLVVVRESLGDELPRVDTPNATVYVKDYGVFRIAAADQNFTELVVRSGRAEVVTDRRSEEVRADEQAFVEGDSRIDIDSGGSYDNLERWARRLDEEGNVDSQYVGDDLRYAAAPLSRYGSWIDIEGSYYWRPRVAAGWRPYWNGRWAYTPSGNTWVSYDPWGWVPHHYGSWDYLPAYGWVWLPGYRWSPAWVYWYQGPAYTGWCPTGYYTRYYGAHWGHGFGFHFGVYGWAGGDWGYFNHWTFVSSNYWHGYHNGYHDGYRDGRHDNWHDQRNVQRYAVPIDELRGRGQLDRGVITTDTRRLTPEVLQDPQRAVAVLSQDPSARRGRSGGDLPDVSDFIARKPELTDNLRRAIATTENEGGQLDGTPLRPGTMGRVDRGVRGARQLPSARTDAGDGANDMGREAGRVVAGGDAERSGARSGRSARPSAGVEPGAVPRDESPRSDRGVRARPDISEGEPPSRGGYREQSGGYSRPATRSGSTRSDAGYRRPEVLDRRVSEPRTSERPRSTDRGGSSERPSSPSRSGGYERPSSPSPRAYDRPSSSPRGGSERPSASPRTYERPSSSSPRASERPSPSPRTYERPSPPSSSGRGSYDRPSSSGGSDRGGRSAGSTRSGSSDRGSSSRGSSSGGRSAHRPPPER